MATKSKTSKEGQPRWTYAAGAIVGVGGLVWGIVSHFLPPKHEAQKPAAAAPAPSVSVSGSGSVGVGSMTGGQIVLGAPPAVATPASSGAPKASSAP